MKITPRYHSLSVKLLISVIAWVICAIFFTGYALGLLWQLENAGIDINYAGSLRMKTYHMVTLLHTPDSDPRLEHEQQQFLITLNRLNKLDRNKIIFPNNSKIDNQIIEIKHSYQHDILPIMNTTKTLDQNLSQENFKQIEEFVERINVLVKLIENQNTKNIIWLRFIQTIAIMMVIFTAFSAIYFLYQTIIKPLRYLQIGIQALSHGNLSERVTITSKDEFGAVSEGFNNMANNLQDLYNNLEQKVSQKTADLEDKNRELAILYDMTIFLHENHTQDTMLESFLHKIIKLGQANGGFIGILGENKNNLNFLYSHGLPKQPDIVKKCYFSAHCFFDISVLPKNPNPIYIKTNTQNNLQLPIPPCIQKAFNHFIIFPIWHNNNEIGMIVLYFKKDYSVDKQTNHLIKTLIKQLAISIESQQLTLKEKQLAILEERNLIAQGLHDSIAQSLSFLNLQIQMLQKAINNKQFDRVKQNLAFIQKGIQDSYEDVRELLLNFRTKISHKEDFKEVVEKVIQRFRAQTKLNVEVNNLNQHFFLTQQQQLQVIFILQEALSNIRKHAQCTLIKIYFHCNKEFIMHISDNGVGFDIETLKYKKQRHVGLSIMKERTEKVSGTITIQSKPNHGTMIELTIPQ